MPKVYNFYHKDAPDDAVMVSRQTIFGNPYTIGEHGNREQVIKLYESYFAARPGLIALAKERLKGKDLICFCTPKSCHADILLKVANE